MNILEVKNLSIYFNTNNDNQILAASNISFSILKGETLSIVGESGSGKSITGLSIMKLLPYPLASHGVESKILFKGEDVLKKSKLQMRKLRGKKISMIFQEPMTSLNPFLKCGEQIKESIFFNFKKFDKKKRVIDLLGEVEFEDPKKIYNSYPHQISGGQRQRVMIAMAIANEPDLLIADEPTTALDVTVEQSLLKLLKKIQKKMGMSIIFISHDLNIVRKISDRVLVMQKGEIKEENLMNEIFQNPRDSYTQRLINSSPEPKEGTITSKDEILKISSLNLTYSKRDFIGRKSIFSALKNINLSIKKNSALGLVGESGSGKSSLARSILGIEKFSGEIFFNDKNILNYNNQEKKHFKKNCQLVFQDPYSSLSPRQKIFDIVKEGLDIHEPSLTFLQKKEKVFKVLEEVKMDVTCLTKFPHEFSGGQRQRIALAKVLILEPELLILDEPTSALDISIQKEVINLLLDLQSKRGLSYLLISHDLKVINAIADEIVVLKSGKIVEKGRRDDIFHDAKEQYTKSLIQAAYN
jgi:ABC-type microcin C transport system duplicated ATPase subunit YejF